MGQRSLLGLTLGALCLSSTFAQADALGLKIGANLWQQDYSGDVQDGPDPLDLKDTLNLEDDEGAHVYIAFEHPIPLIPNIKLQRTELEVDGDTTISEQFEFDGDTYEVGGDLSSRGDFSHTDATLYYEVLDNWVSLDIGLTARVFDGDIELNSVSGGVSSSEDLDGVVPMLYGAVKFDLPLTGLYVGAEANVITISDSSVFDYMANIGWESSIGLGVEAGYRSLALDLDDKDEEADVTIDGAYIGLFFHF